MAQVRPGAEHPHGIGRRDLWDTITSAVGNAFDPSDDKDSKTTTSTTPKAEKTKTEKKTVLTTDAPSTYTGPLTTKTTSTKAAAKTTTPTTTAEKTTTTKSSSKTTEKTTAKTTAKTTNTAKGLPTSIAATTAGTTDTKLALDTTQPTTTSATVTSAAASATNTATASTGTSTAAKAGIAIGVLAGVFFVFAIVFFLFRKHRKQVEARRIADDEKVNGPFADSAAIGGVQQKQSRLSLKPVAQFLGGAGAGAAAGAAANSQYDSGFPSRRQSRGANIAMRDQPPMSARSQQPGSAWDRPNTGNDGNNPFGDGAQRLNSPFSPGQHGFPGMGPPSPDANGVSPISPGSAGVAFAGGAAAGAVAGGMLTRKASTRKDGPNALDLTLAAPNNNLGPVPPSPAGTEYSMHSIAPGAAMDASAGGAAIAAAGGPAVSTVHRVQLDFKPTLEDELELRAGQLVRLLHEYDDGWALCIRLDRSKQGVVPRTCLSTRPVKPRPPQNGGRAGPPVNPSGRPMTPQGGPRGPGRMGPGPMGVPASMMPGQGARPQSPAMNRPNTPQGGPPSQMMNNGQMRPQSPYGGPPGGPRSASPAGARSMSPAPGSIGRPQSPAELPSGPANNGSRPQSPAGASVRKVTPPGPSPMSQQMRPTNSIGRKPVPGQAY
ncbi:hypothetical protein Sste5346_009499 [Sporothrix stenoceras]|uniref:SH3 domain-containing protein n=1 Tax=Sporothrix stenoceras TaxID=5173 RepID=A0ABR3YK45_9PEZI